MLKLAIFIEIGTGGILRNKGPESEIAKKNMHKSLTLYVKQSKRCSLCNVSPPGSNGLHKTFQSIDAHKNAMK